MPRVLSSFDTRLDDTVYIRLAANDIPDAWLAAVVIQLDERLVTFDTDFKKLLRRPQLTVLSPD